MARVRVFIVLVLAITVGGVFAYGTYNYVQNAPKPGPGVPTKPVVVAAADLDLGADLTRDDLRVVEWPANAAPAGAFNDVKDVVGRGLIMPVIQNEPILPNKLATKEAGAGLPPAIPPGLRAVSVRVNEVIGVAGYVLPGTRVDVVATVSPNGNAMDIRFPGVPVFKIRQAARSLQMGGVGFYPRSGFVHLDTGPIRYW